MSPHTRADCDALYAQLVEAIGHLSAVDAEPCWRELLHALYGVAGDCRRHVLHVAAADADRRRLPGWQW